MNVITCRACASKPLAGIVLGISGGKAIRRLVSNFALQNTRKSRMLTCNAFLTKWANVIFCEMDELHHYYHVYADGEWEETVREHLQALKTSFLGAQEGFSFSVGLVGTDRNTASVRDFLNRHSIRWREIACCQEGWEQVTLDVLARESHFLEGFVFYAHTKGASNSSRFNTLWRQRMTHYTVTCWREALLSLETHHAYGCHWMELEGNWLFAGNFWWTRMSYLRLLPPPRTHSRWAAEGWIGQLPRYIGVFAACDPAPPFPGKIRSQRTQSQSEDLVAAEGRVAQKGDFSKTKSLFVRRK